MAVLTLEDLSKQPEYRGKAAFQSITFSSLTESKKVHIRINDHEDRETGIFIDRDGVEDLIAFLQCQLRKD